MEKEEKKEETSVSGAQATDNKYVWIVGFVLLLIGGWFGWNMLFGVQGEYKVTLIDAPKQISPGVATFTWRVDGPATTVNNTEIYFGTTSNPGELGKDVKPADTKYTNFVKDFANGKYNIPLQFVGNTYEMTTPGMYYFRVHTTVKDKNYWTDEFSIEVKKPEYAVVLLDYPKTVTVNTMVTFTWRVDGSPTTIPHTSMHFSRESTPGDLGKDILPADTKYSELIKDFEKGSYNIPLQFVGNHKFTRTGPYYFRGHAIINDQNFWTQEYSIEVQAASASAATQ